MNWFDARIKIVSESYLHTLSILGNLEHKLTKAY